MIARLAHLMKALRTGQGVRIVAAVGVMGVLLISAAWPLMKGLERNYVMASSVSQQLVPTANQVRNMVKHMLEAKSALEVFLLTSDLSEQHQFNEALDRIHISLSELESMDQTDAFGHDHTLNRQLVAVRKLLSRLEDQGKEVYALHQRPDNVKAAHLINTRGEKLLARTYAYIHMVMDTALNQGNERDMLFFSAMTGYQDSLSRMMSSVRGYLFMKEARFQLQYSEELRRNTTIYGIVHQNMTGGNPAAMAFFKMIDASRSRLLQTLEEAFELRNASSWRQDLFYYNSQIVPTLESFKWALYALSDSTSEAIVTHTSDSMAHSLSLREGSVATLAVVLLIGAMLGGWIFWCVRVFTRRVGEASTDLERMAYKVDEETGQQAREVTCQVQEIGDVYRNIHVFKDTISSIRSQTEVMTQQTDIASLECVQGMEVLSDSQERMAAILRNAREISTAMEKAKAQTQQMDGILAILDELVDQTKLLSFNATIEAAGAGISGTRFAVVAKHVRRLANRAQESTQEIRGMIRKIQQTTEETRQATERGTIAVNEGEGLMHVVTERLDAIVAAVSQVSDVAGSIYIATQDQDRAIVDVDRFVDQARETSERVSVRTDRNLETVAALRKTAENLHRLAGLE